jgi:hypothetical protein
VQTEFWRNKGASRGGRERRGSASSRTGVPQRFMRTVGGKIERGVPRIYQSRGGTVSAEEAGSVAAGRHGR